MERLFRKYMKEMLRLDLDKADDSQIIQGISGAVEFKGTNLWILIFAVFIASIGLDVNSTAVIIGAMLISPLMGPIIGVGAAIAINDVPLLRKSAINLATATFFSIAASCLYFLISPLDEARSELLARTSPSLWDVLIAVFGGFAGAIAVTRKEKSNVFPGVAIATALMPPLCTTGFGLASGDIEFLLGAFYLYFINSVFIAISAFSVMKILKVPVIKLMDARTERQVRTIITTVVILTIAPSIYLTYRVLEKTVFTKNANAFIKNEFVFDNTRPIQVDIDARERIISVFLIGEEIAETELEKFKSRLPRYDLPETRLIVHQGFKNNAADPPSLEEIKSELLEEIITRNELLLEQKENQIRLLERDISKLKGLIADHESLSRELNALYPDVISIATGFTLQAQDTIPIALVSAKRRFTKKDMGDIQKWFKARIRNDKSVLIFN